MNAREHFRAIMHYQPVDRGLIADFGFWDETLTLWKKQGLPRSVNKQNFPGFFGMDYTMRRISSRIGVTVDLSPRFQTRVLEDYGDTELFQQADGVRVLRQKTMRSIPMPKAHLLTDRESWQKYFKPRLNPANSSRYPKDWNARVTTWCDPHRPTIISLPGGSLYGRLRNWMGVEKLSLVVYDDPSFFEEMVVTMGDCIVGSLERVLATGGQFEACGMWEDMCYNAGPLLSPRHFKKYLVPQYRRITDLLHKYGVDVIYLDCDGNIEALMPLWLDAGVNGMYPLEIGTWGADPIRYRRQYGKDLLILGGFDKHLLAGDKKGIEKEVYRLLPLVEEGGFIGFCDHLVPPDVPLDNYVFYLRTVRRVWGKNQSDLNPMDPRLDKMGW